MSFHYLLMILLAINRSQATTATATHYCIDDTTVLIDMRPGDRSFQVASYIRDEAQSLAPRVCKWTFRVLKIDEPQQLVMLSTTGTIDRGFAALLTLRSGSIELLSALTVLPLFKSNDSVTLSASMDMRLNRSVRQRIEVRLISPGVCGVGMLHSLGRCFAVTPPGDMPKPTNGVELATFNGLEDLRAFEIANSQLNSEHGWNLTVPVKVNARYIRSTGKVVRRILTADDKDCWAVAYGLETRVFFRLPSTEHCATECWLVLRLHPPNNDQLQLEPIGHTAGVLVQNLVSFPDRQARCDRVEQEDIGCHGYREQTMISPVDTSSDWGKIAAIEMLTFCLAAIVLAVAIICIVKIS